MTPTDSVPARPSPCGFSRPVPPSIGADQNVKVPRGRRKSRTDVRRQATEDRLVQSPFRCWRCGKVMTLSAGALHCSNCGAEHRPRRGVLELLPPGREPAPGVFDSWYGRLYDAGVNRRDLVVPGAFLLWGADVAGVFRLMDSAIACEPGQVVLDAPTGC